MGSLIKASVGAAATLVIAYFSKSKFYFVAGMIPLFPMFAILSNLIVAQDRSMADLRESILFGMITIIPYFAYLISMYILLPKMNLILSIVSSVGVWVAISLPLVFLWKA